MNNLYLYLYLCNFCGDTFTRKYNLNRHQTKSCQKILPNKIHITFCDDKRHTDSKPGKFTVPSNYHNLKQKQKTI